MANKQIADLQLRSDADATINIPVQDASQAWRVTMAQIVTYLQSVLALTDANLAADSVTTVKILNANVTLAKIANIAAGRILGNNTGGAATALELTAAQINVMLGTKISGIGTWTPTIAGCGTPTGVVGIYKDVGNWRKCFVYFISGTPTAALASATLPGSGTLDTAGLPIPANTTAAAGFPVGRYGANGTSSAASWGYVVTAPGTATDKVYFGPNPNSSAASFVPGNGNTFFLSGMAVFMEFEVPISGLGGTTV